MSEQKHTPEPWALDQTDTRDEAQAILDAHGGPVADVFTKDRHGECEANAARIVACVNALAGIEKPEEWVKEAKRVMFARQFKEGTSVEIISNESTDIPVGTVVKVLANEVFDNFPLKVLDSDNCAQWIHYCDVKIVS